MPDNPYTREASLTILELVPDKGQLPYCSARLSRDINTLCGLRARYLQNGNPVCGVHLGRPGTLFIPEKR